MPCIDLVFVSVAASAERDDVKIIDAVAEPFGGPKNLKKQLPNLAIKYTRAVKKINDTSGFFINQARQLIQKLLDFFIFHSLYLFNLMP